MYGQNTHIHPIFVLYDKTISYDWNISPPFRIATGDLMWLINGYIFIYLESSKTELHYVTMAVLELCVD